MKFTGEKTVRITVVLNVLVWSLIAILFFWDFGGDDRAKTVERTIEARQRAMDLERKHENGQNLKLQSHEERLKVLETAVVDLLRANPKQSASAVVQPAVRQDESVSDEDFRAMVLKNVKRKEKMAIVKHFRQEDEFKKSLKPAEKRKFDADVKKAYENLLAECGIEKGSLDKWQANALRQSVETGVILEWRMDDYLNRRVAVQPVSAEEREEKLEKFRLLNNQLAELAGETEAEGE